MLSGVEFISKSRSLQGRFCFSFLLWSFCCCFFSEEEGGGGLLLFLCFCWVLFLGGGVSLLTCLLNNKSVNQSIYQFVHLSRSNLPFHHFLHLCLHLLLHFPSRFHLGAPGSSVGGESDSGSRSPRIEIRAGHLVGSTPTERHYPLISPN